MIDMNKVKELLKQKNIRLIIRIFLMIDLIIFGIVGTVFLIDSIKKDIFKHNILKYADSAVEAYKKISNEKTLQKIECFSLEYLKENGYIDADLSKYYGSIRVEKNDDNYKYTLWISNNEYYVSKGTKDNMIVKNGSSAKELSNTCNYTGTSSSIGTLVKEDCIFNPELSISENIKTLTDKKCDITKDHGYRFIGENPNNYVLFNDEIWRIIGLFEENYDSNGDGKLDKKGYLVKIIRNNILGNLLYDFKGVGLGNSLHEYGSNDWSQSQLMFMLNPTDYINSGYNSNGNLSHNGFYVQDNYVYDNKGNKLYKNPGSYWDESLDIIDPDLFSKVYNRENNTLHFKKMSDDAGKMVATVKWNLGGFASQYQSETASAYYKYERGNKALDLTHPVYWIGKVGLMYVSDYAYAVGGIHRDYCLEKSLYNWDTVITKCAYSDWLFYADSDAYTIGHQSNQWVLDLLPSDEYQAVLSIVDGRDRTFYSISHFEVRPSVYLNENVVITSGLGTYSDPYVLEM